MFEPVKMAFERHLVVLPLSNILPMRRVPDSIKQTLRYKRIIASIGEVGIVEPLVVARQQDDNEPYMLVDGHLRHAALLDLGTSEAPCLIADDDEAFTYNKRVNRLATIQEHYMIVKAIERGVSEEKLARALNVDIKRIKTKRTLLDGVCSEVAELLKDKSVDTTVFTLLRKMKPMRQIEAVELMSAMNNFTARYAHALLAATRQEDLAQPERPKNPWSDGRADGPHGARDGWAATRVQSRDCILRGYGVKSRSRLRLPFEPHGQYPGQPLSRTPPPGNPRRIQSHRRGHIIGGKRFRPAGGITLAQWSARWTGCSMMTRCSIWWSPRVMFQACHKLTPRAGLLGLMPAIS
jgi:ParB-like chromosome segregation protein Spo0J